MKKTILLTGGTGFIGKRLVASLAKEAKEIILLVRAKSVAGAKREFGAFENVRLLEADLLEPRRLGITDQVEVARLRSEVTDVVHAAALYDLNAKAKEIYLNSLLITQNLVKFCNSMEKLATFHHVSTYAVNVALSGQIPESALCEKPDVREPYSWAKNRSEWVIENQLNPGVKRRTYRPGVVIGDSVTGAVEKWDGPYYLVGTMLKAKKALKGLPLALPLPYTDHSSLPIIPVNELERRLTHLILHPTATSAPRTYHLVPENPLNFASLVNWISSQIGLKMKIVRVPPALVPATVEKLAYRALRLPESSGNFLRKSQYFRTDQLREDFPELTYFHKLQSTSTPWIREAVKYAERGGKTS